jgi:hypothetical protein
MKPAAFQRLSWIYSLDYHRAIARNNNLPPKQPIHQPAIEPGGRFRARIW